MECVDEPLPGVFQLSARTFCDERGWFRPLWSPADVRRLGIVEPFVQENLSLSHAPGTVRGLHLQLPPSAQGKLVQVVTGAVLDVVVDLRASSPSWGQHCAVRLDAHHGGLLWLPPGMAHGFCTLEPATRVLYQVTAPYEPARERTVRWDDAALAIEWPVRPSDAILSERDRHAPVLADLVPELSCASW